MKLLCSTVPGSPCTDRSARRSRHRDLLNVSFCFLAHNSDLLGYPFILRQAIRFLGIREEPKLEFRNKKNNHLEIPLLNPNQVFKESREAQRSADPPC